MALPTDSSDTFLREVDENLRRDRAQDFAKTYGKWLVAALVLFLAAVGGYLYWKDRQRAAAEVQSEELSKIYADIGTGKLAGVPARLQALQKDGGPVVRATSLLAEAAVALNANDRATAIARYRTLAGDADLPQAYRDTATVRMTALEFDSLQPDAIIARLKPLAKPGEPWFAGAAEMTAMALLRQGKKDEAGRLFAAIGADRSAPDSSRDRAIQIAGTLGVDASASLETLSQDSNR